VKNRAYHTNEVSPSENLAQRAKKVRLLALDVDGVLTPGTIVYGSSGEELKVFNVKDGLGIRRLRDGNISVAIITGRSSFAVDRRAKDLDICHVFQGIKDKWSVLTGLCRQLDISVDEVAYMGDDLPDLEVLEKVGLAACPADAVEVVLKVCHFVSKHEGGNGAVRELCDLIGKG
jgi:3-deoxy-D-manno-octulosonate 8-phosphate phosphatase (KDO 8-P phosphatase)